MDLFPTCMKDLPTNKQEYEHSVFLLHYLIINVYKSCQISIYCSNVIIFQIH